MRRREFLNTDVVHRIKQHKRSASDSRIRRRNPEFNYSSPLHLSKVFEHMPPPQLQNSNFSGIMAIISRGLQSKNSSKRSSFLSSFRRAGSSNVRIEKISAYTGTRGRDQPMLIHEADDPAQQQVMHTSQIGLLDDPEGHNLPSDVSFVNEMILTSNEQRLSQEIRRHLQVRDSRAISVGSDALDSLENQSANGEGREDRRYVNFEQRTTRLDDPEEVSSVERGEPLVNEREIEFNQVVRFENLLKEIGP